MNTKEMPVSIIIPTYNEAANIQHLVNYLQQYSPEATTEIIVVNACKTTDDTASIAQSAGARVYECKDCCRAAQMNLGAANAQFEILYFVHADVLPPPSFQRDIQQAFQEGNVFGWFSFKFDSSSKWLKINARYTRGDGIFAGGGGSNTFY
ncbi:MAG: glycosyltransferase [Bacteroidota bacterium]